MEFVPVLKGPTWLGVGGGNPAMANCGIRLINVARRVQVAELRGHSDYVHAVAWNPDCTQLVSGSGDFTIRVWDSLSLDARVTWMPRGSRNRPPMIHFAAHWAFP